MKINSVSNYNQNVNFKSAKVNILATSDNHGNVHSLPKFVKTVEANKDEIFVDPKKDNALNIFAIAGDWFINPSKKGFITKAEMTNGDIQLGFLKKTIAAVKEAAGGGDNFKTIFSLGNHDFDGGDKFVYKVIETAPMDTLITNVDLKKSPEIVNLRQKDKCKCKTSIVYEIPDDKNPNLTNKILFLGITIPTMDFYNPGLLKRMQFLDNGNVKDADLTEKDIQGTINAVKEEVEQFKKENPRGVVVLQSHMGNTLSKIVRINVPQIDVILNGHDHKNKTSLRGSTNINSLGKDNEIIKSINLYFNDEGKLDSKDLNTYFCDLTLMDEMEEHPLQVFLKENFSEDMKPIVSLRDTKGNPAELDYGDEIRYSNSYLANYLTSAIKRSVRDVEPEVFSVGLQSSIIRGGIKHNSNNLDLMKIFDGVSEDLSNLQIGNVTGEELVGLITENVISNLKAPTRNTIIHWSDIQINRSLISDIKYGFSDKEYKDAIMVRNQKTKQFEPIDMNKSYKIVLADKYLIKDDIEWPKKIRSKFVSLDKTYDNMFREYLKNIQYDMRITDKTKERRII